jgi:hypothetical protein
MKTNLSHIKLFCTYLFLLLISISASGQTSKQPVLKKITRIEFEGQLSSEAESRGMTEEYQFKGGKLVSIVNIKGKPGTSTSFYYNEKGLLETIARKYYSGDGDGDKIIYDKNGLIVKVYRSFNIKKGEDGLNPSEETKAKSNIREIRYDINGENFTIKTTTSRLGREGISISDGQVITKNENVIELDYKSSNFLLTYENGNLLDEKRTKPSEEKYLVNYSYDQNPNVYTLLLKNMLGDAYFINSFSLMPIETDYGLSVSRYNYLSAKTLEAENVSISDKESMIEYNSNKMPTKITTKWGRDYYIVSYFEYE